MRAYLALAPGSHSGLTLWSFLFVHGYVPSKLCTMERKELKQYFNKVNELNNRPMYLPSTVFNTMISRADNLEVTV